MARLSREFYTGDTVEIARQLLGKYIVRRLDGEDLVCRITETEAYVGRMDKACHAYNYRHTPRTSTMFGPPGHAYIYLIYGMYNCLNFVTEPEGEPSAVLLRGAVPVAGLGTISRLRFGCSYGEMHPYQRRHWMDGPGKICKGLSLSREDNGIDLTGDTLFLTDDPGPAEVLLPRREVIRSGPRIGIDYAEEAITFPWRFWLEEED